MAVLKWEKLHWHPKKRNMKDFASIQQLLMICLFLLKTFGFLWVFSFRIKLLFPRCKKTYASKDICQKIYQISAISHTCVFFIKYQHYNGFMMSSLHKNIFNTNFRNISLTLFLDGSVFSVSSCLSSIDQFSKHISLLILYHCAWNFFACRYIFKII